MKKKIILLLCMAMLLAACCVGCGKNDKIKFSCHNEKICAERARKEAGRRCYI